MINKRLFLAGLTTGLLSLSAAFPAMAGSWKNGAGDNAARWWYDNGDNTWAANGWRWIDGNQDGVSECYYFDAEGWLLTSTTTPDGYNVSRRCLDGKARSVHQTAASNESDNSWDDFQNGSSKAKQPQLQRDARFRKPDSSSSSEFFSDDSSNSNGSSGSAAIQAPVRPKHLLPETKSRMLKELKQGWQRLPPESVTDEQIANNSSSDSTKDK
ncbi:MAG: hypothetical protein ACLR3S_10120 [Clostridium fessum]